MCRTQDRESVSQAADRIRQFVQREPRVRLTTLHHHVTVDALRWAFYELEKDVAAGADGRRGRCTRKPSAFVGQTIMPGYRNNLAFHPTRGLTPQSETSESDDQQPLRTEEGPRAHACEPRADANNQNQFGVPDPSPGWSCRCPRVRRWPPGTGDRGPNSRMRRGNRRALRPHAAACMPTMARTTARTERNGGRARRPR